MAETIRGFQEDKAVLLVEAIRKYDPKTLVSVERVHYLMVKHGIVSDLTHWGRIERVLDDLGYDYDEIFEVLSR